MTVIIIDLLPVSSRKKPYSNFRWLLLRLIKFSHTLLSAHSWHNASELWKWLISLAINELVNWNIRLFHLDERDEILIFGFLAGCCGQLLCHLFGEKFRYCDSKREKDRTVAKNADKLSSNRKNYRLNVSRHTTRASPWLTAYEKDIKKIPISWPDMWVMLAWLGHFSHTTHT